MPLTEAVLKSILEGLHGGDICDVQSGTEPCDVKKLVSECSGKYEISNRIVTSKIETKDAIITYTSIKKIK